ncbi:MAG TPA: NTP transferase domain-containing protein [Steroidobacteraceae bacterium]|jgi:molybdopterin-guanine dinucleotide biosynthesis protein A|nr:NTP transferase domain-containing protein [Steroidobacteraceae bacterium]
MSVHPAPRADAAPLYGLLLAGGRSTRMGRDKAALAYDGKPQLERAMALLQRHVARAFVSVRADQSADPLRARYPQIADTRADIGPVAGLLAAQERHPGVAWLVLACDLPLLDESTLAQLVRERAPQRTATAFRSSHDGLPEPLCAIYEPHSHGPLVASVAQGRHCPRKFLLSADVRLLDEPNPRALDNVNTATEYGALMNEVRPQPGAADKRITVQYYALLREQAGRREEALATAARTPRELYTELSGRYRFTLAPEMLRVAINAEFRDWSTPLAEGDAVVFIPPVAGG